MLLAHADVDLALDVGEYGKTLLHEAAELGNMGVLRQLLVANADPEAWMPTPRDSNGEMPLLHAARSEHDAVVAFASGGARRRSELYGSEWMDGAILCCRGWLPRRRRPIAVTRPSYSRT